MSVMDHVRLMQWNALFVFNSYGAVFYPHHRTDGFCQGFVLGMENKAAFKKLVSKSW